MAKRPNATNLAPISDLNVLPQPSHASVGRLGLWVLMWYSIPNGVTTCLLHIGHVNSFLPPRITPEDSSNRACAHARSIFAAEPEPEPEPELVATGLAVGEAASGGFAVPLAWLLDRPATTLDLARWLTGGLSSSNTEELPAEGLNNASTSSSASVAESRPRFRVRLEPAA